MADDGYVYSHVTIDYRIGVPSSGDTEEVSHTHAIEDVDAFKDIWVLVEAVVDYFRVRFDHV